MAFSHVTHLDRTPSPPSVLIIDDSESLRLAGVELRDHGFTVLEECDSGLGARRVREQTPQVIMVNEKMPPVDGVGLVEALREVTTSPIMVVGEGAHTSQAQALLDGADMYISRPVSPREMLARVRALLRRNWVGECGDPTACTNASIRMDSGDLGLILDHLTNTEAKLFRFLLDRADHLVTREELLNRIWGDEGKDTSLRFYIWQLRRKLLDFSSASSSVEVLNFNGMGYLLKVTPLTNVVNEGETAG